MNYGMVPTIKAEIAANACTNYGFFDSPDRLFNQITKELDRVIRNLDELNDEIRGMINDR